MKIGKVNAGHFSDGGEGPGYEMRMEFVDDCVRDGKVAVSFAFPGQNPFGELDEATMKNITASALKEMFEDCGIKEGRAKNAADQIIRFRDWNTGLPLLLYRGRNTISRMGYLSGPYRFQPEGFQGGKYNGYQHVRDVEWAEVPQEINRSMLPDDMEKWVKNPQTALDYDVEPRSDAADFLSLAWGLGFTMSDLEPHQRRVLR